MTALLVKSGPRLVIPGAVVVALLLGVATAMSPMLGIAGCIAVLSMLGMTYSASFALAAYVFVTYFEVLSSQAMLTPVKVTGILLVVLSVARAAVRIRERGTDPGALVSAPIVVAGLVAFTAMAFASGGWDSSSMLWKLKTQMLISNVVVFFAMASLLRTLGHQRVVAWAGLAGASITTLYGFATGAELAGRSIGGFGDPNEFATVLVASIALGYGALVGTSRNRLKLLAALGMSICFAGIIASQSRGGLIGLVAMAIAISVTARGRERTRLVGIALIGLAVFGAIFASSIGAGLRDRIQEDGSSGRSNLWRISMAIWKDHPGMGVGTGSFSVMVPRYLTPEHTSAGPIQSRGEVAHNIYFETLAELGAIGITAFVLFVGGILVRVLLAVRSARKLGDPGLSATARAAFAALVGVLVCDSFLSGQYQEMFWVVLACALAAAHVVRLQVRREAEEIG